MVRSRFLAGMMVFLYSHTLVHQVWADAEALAHGTLRIQAHTSRGCQIDFEGYSLHQEKMAFHGKQPPAAPFQWEDPPSFKVQALPGAHPDESILEADALGTFFLTPQGALGFRGHRKAHEGRLRIESNVPLVLYDVYLKELEILGGAVTFQGTSRIETLKGRMANSSHNSTPLYEVGAHSVLDVKSLQLENLALLNAGTIQSPTTLTLSSRTLYTTGTLKAAEGLTVTADEVIFNEGTWQSPTLEGQAAVWKETGTLQASQVKVKATQRVDIEASASWEAHTTHLEAPTLEIASEIAGQDALLKGERVRLQAPLSPTKTLDIQAAKLFEAHSNLTTEALSLALNETALNYQRMQASSLILTGAGTLENHGWLQADKILDLALASLHNRGHLYATSSTVKGRLHNDGTAHLGTCSGTLAHLQNTQALTATPQGLLHISTLTNQGQLHMQGLTPEDSPTGGSPAGSRPAGHGLTGGSLAGNSLSGEIKVDKLTQEGTLTFDKLKMTLGEVDTTPASSTTFEGCYDSSRTDSPVTLRVNKLTAQGPVTFKNLKAYLQRFENHSLASWEGGHTTVNHTTNHHEMHFKHAGRYLYGRSFKNFGTFSTGKGLPLTISVGPQLTNQGTFVTDQSLTLRNKTGKDGATLLTRPEGFQPGKSLILHSDTFTLKGGEKLSLPYGAMFFLKEYTNYGYMEVAGPLYLFAKNLFKLGLNNDVMGGLVTKGPLTLKVSSLDNRYGKIYSSEDVTITAQRGDIEVGHEKQVMAPHAQTHFGACCLTSAVYPKSCPNGAYISSQQTMTLQAPEGHTTVDYGELFAEKDLSVKTHPQRGTFRVLGGKVHTAGSLKVTGAKADFKIPGVKGFAASSSNSHYTHIVYYLEFADPAHVQALEDIDLNVREVYNLASHLLAGKRLLFTGQPLFTATGVAQLPSRFRMEPLARYYSEVERGNRYYTHYDRVSSLPASLKAGEALYATHGNFSITGTLNAPQIVLNIDHLLARNTQRSRPEPTLPQQSLIIDLTAVARTLYTPQGFIRRLEDGRVGTGHDSGLTVPPALLYLNQAPERSLPWRMMLDPVAMRFVVQEALSQYAGTLNLQGQSGRTLLEALQERGATLSQQCPQQLMSWAQAQQAVHSFIAYQAQRLGDEIALLPHLVIPPAAVNPYQSEGDISGDRISIHTTGNQHYQSTRVVAQEEVKLEAGGTIHRETLKYTMTDHRGDTVITQEVACPREEVRSLHHNVTALSQGDYHEVGTYTAAARNLTRGSTQGNVTVEALTLKREETTTTTKRGLFSSQTQRETATTHSHLANHAVAREIDALQSDATTTIRGGIEQGGEAVRITAAQNVTIEPMVTLNKYESTSTASGFLGRQHSQQSSESVSVQPSIIQGPLIVLEGEEATLTGSVIQGEKLHNKTTHGMTVGPHVVEVKQETSTHQSHTLGQQASGSSTVQEVGIPMVLDVEEIDTTASPFTAVDTPLPEDITGEVKHDHRPLRSWSHSWSSGSGLSLGQTAAFLAIVTGIATGTWGPTLASQLGISSKVGVSMLRATVSGMASSVASSTYSHHGDVFAGLREATSAQALRGIAVQALSAGLMKGVGLPDPQGLASHLKTSSLQAAIQAGLKMTLQGMDPKEGLRQGLLQAGVDALAGAAASKIGENRHHLNYVAHKVLHGAIGAAMGEVLKKDPVSGALGAVVAEVLGEFLVANTAQRLPELYAQAAAQGPVSRKAIDDLYQEEIKKAIDWNHIGAAGAALVAGQDVNLAARAADNALSHNLGPSVLIGAYMVGSTAWTAYDVYDTYQKEGVEAALEKLVAQGVIDVATRGVFKVAGKLYPHPELAWAAALKHVPFLQEMSQALGHLGRKFQSTFVKKVASTKPASSMKAPPVSKATDKAKKSQKADKVEKAERVSQTAPKAQQAAKHATKEQPWKVRKGQEWKTKVYGKAQKTQTPGHAARSYREAIREAKKANTETVFLNRGYNKATGLKIKSNRRPDVIIKKKDGTIHPREVPSKSDDIGILKARNHEALKKLPKHMRGEYDMKVPTFEKVIKNESL